MSNPALVLAGRAIPDAGDRIRRYCGLPWSGGPPETWAYRYYDAVPTDDSDRISPAWTCCRRRHCIPGFPGRT